MNKIISSIFVLSIFTFSACDNTSEPKVENEVETISPNEKKLNEYVEFTLTSDLSKLSENQRKMIPILIEVAEIMDGLFWKEAYGDKEALLSSLTKPEDIAFCKINYGPWDRLGDNAPFIEGVGVKPLGAQYYPLDMTVEEFEAFDDPTKASLYTMIERTGEGNLISIPFHDAFSVEVERASELLLEAAKLADDPGFKKYLTLRAKALLDDDYLASDLAWMDMKNNKLDFVVGPIENYEDKLFNYKAAHEAYILIKDLEWSEKLAKYVSFLPELQENLPVPPEYKKEKPGADSDLNAYDVVYYAGDCNAGSKTIAINLPNDERVQLEKGTRRLQLKNAMKAKFDKIMLPISEILIDETQRKHVTFDAFFGNTMFHEVAHGLGIKNTLDGKSTVRKALLEHGSALEEGKADILGVYMITQLHAKGEVDGELMDYYTTFLAGIFRSVRFGAASAHGKANMIRFNYFAEQNAFTFNPETGTYFVNFENFQKAIDGLSNVILVLQGNGDYAGVDKLFNEMGVVGPQLQKDLDKISNAGIPRDVIFNQGLAALGLLPQ